MSARAVGLCLGGTLCGTLWLVALASHLGGNQSAINALVGIPLGAPGGLFLIWVVTHADAA